MQTNFSALLPDTIPNNETIIMPISMSQSLQRGERLAAIIKSLHEQQYANRTTILVCDYLNRYNCDNETQAIEQGDVFLHEHRNLFEGLSVVRWQDFLTTRDKTLWDKSFAILSQANLQGSHFRYKMQKTWEKCLSARGSLEASIHYQMEEYAAVLCMKEFDHLFYPKRISHGLAYVYNYFSEKKPKYHLIKLLENKGRHQLPAAFRALIEHTEALLSSGEISGKAKSGFIQEAEKVLKQYKGLTHGL